MSYSNVPPSCWIRRSAVFLPLPLGFHAEVIAHLAKGDFDRSALDEPADDVERRTIWIGAGRRLWLERAVWITQQTLETVTPR